MIIIGLITNKNPCRKITTGIFICDPVGTRTQDPIIKSDVLYQLSYEIFTRFLGVQK